MKNVGIEFPRQFLPSDGNNGTMGGGTGISGHRCSTSIKVSPPRNPSPWNFVSGNFSHYPPTPPLHQSHNYPCLHWARRRTRIRSIFPSQFVPFGASPSQSQSRWAARRAASAGRDTRRNFWRVRVAPKDSKCLATLCLPSCRSGSIFAIDSPVCHSAGRIMNHLMD